MDIEKLLNNKFTGDNIIFKCDTKKDLIMLFNNAENLLLMAYSKKELNDIKNNLKNKKHYCRLYKENSYNKKDFYYDFYLIDNLTDLNFYYVLEVINYSSYLRKEKIKKINGF